MQVYNFFLVTNKIFVLFSAIDRCHKDQNSENLFNGYRLTKVHRNSVF